MKRFFILLLICHLLTACKKDRVCNCTITVEGTITSHTQTVGLPPLVNGVDSTTSQPLFTVNSQKKTYKDVTKKDMRRSCFGKSVESVNLSNSTVVPGIYTITTTQNGLKTYDCKIE